MSLDWDVRNVKDFETVCFREATEEDKRYGRARSDGKATAVVTEVLVFGTMAVDMGEITEANHEEFFRRLTLWHSWVGAPVTSFETGEVEYLFITLDEVKAHIGLRTNVFPQKSPKQFEAKLKKVMMDDQNRKAERFMKSLREGKQPE